MALSSNEIDAYLDHLNIERRLSGHTVSAYRRDLLKLMAFCDQRNIRSWGQLTTDQARLFAMSLHASGLDSRSIQRTVSAARGYYKYLLREQRVDQYNPFEGVKAPRGGKKLPQTLDPDAVVRLLQTTPRTPLLMRDLAMLELFYSSGLRLSELVGLDIDSINAEEQTGSRDWQRQ